MNSSQGSISWHQQRLGKITASVVYSIMSDKKNSLTRAKLLKVLALERLSGSPTKNIVTAPMARGLRLESDARIAYEAINQKVELVSFIDHPLIKFAGCSPDGLVGDDGLIEIKCLNEKNHNQVLKKDSIPKPYYIQIQFQLACSQRNWCDFVLYHPDAIETLYIKRVYPDQIIIDGMTKKVILFLDEVNQLHHEIRKSNDDEAYKYM